MVRNRMKTLVVYTILLGIGVTVCLTIIQMNTNSELDSAVVYMNPQAYKAALNSNSATQQQLLLQTQQESPSETSPHTRKNNVRTSNNNDITDKTSNSIRTIYHNDNHVRINRDSNDGDINVDKSSRTVPRDYESMVVGGESTRFLLPQTASSDYKTKQVKSAEPGRTNNILDNDVNYADEFSKFEDGQTPEEPAVWVVTPTFYRPEQRPELTRLAQALLPVRNFIHWIIVDDVTHGSAESFSHLEKFVKRFPLYHTILKSFPPKTDTKIVGKPRGVGGRTAAIQWLRKHAADKNGVVYFADDDNTYDSDIFRQMQHTKRVSMWPVGLVTDLGVSSPIVKNGRVVGFYDGWNGLRKFPVDMAGFAINIQLFRDKPNANMPWVAGYEEDELLRSLGITIQDIAPLANNCTEILVWHTKAVKNKWPKRPKTLKPTIEANTNLNQLLASLPQKSLLGPQTSALKSGSGFSFYNLIFGGL